MLIRVTLSTILALTAVANTHANRRYTFGVQGRTSLVRQHAAWALVFLLAFVPRLPSAESASGLGLSSGSARITTGTKRRLRVFAVTQIAASFVLLTGAGLLTAATALPGAVAMAASFAGMFTGQAVRTRLQPEVFRRWFQVGMIVLGLYLASNALAKLMS